MHRAGDIIHGMWKNPVHQRRLRLVALWKSWTEIVGVELAELAKPLGHKERTLYLGVEDAVVMQEVSFDSPRILKLVNAFLKEAFFDKVRFDLLHERSSLDTVAASLLQPQRSASSEVYNASEAPLTNDLGGLENGFFHISALERCYKAYVRHYRSFSNNE